RQQLTENEGEREVEEVSSAIDVEPSTAVAVNPQSRPANLVSEAGDVYIANLHEGGGEQTSGVTAISPSGALIQSFTAPGLRQAAGIAVSSASGTVYASDAAAGDIQVFPLEAPGPPSVDALSAEGVTAESAQLSAKIDPSGTAGTTYEFQYGTVPCAE